MQKVSCPEVGKYSPVSLLYASVPLPIIVGTVCNLSRFLTLQMESDEQNLPELDSMKLHIIIIGTGYNIIQLILYQQLRRGAGFGAECSLHIHVSCIPVCIVVFAL